MARIKLYKMKFFLMAVIALGSTFASSETVTSIVAEDLVRAMHFDQIALKSSFAPYYMERAQKKGTEDADAKRFYTCLDVGDNPILIKAFAMELEKHMSREAMTVALEFYRGPVGKKELQREADLADSQVGLSPETNDHEFSTVELRELKKFQDTTASKELRLFPIELRKTRSVWYTVISESEKIVSACASLAQKSK